MIKVLFICHGNICRSAMAEFIMKHITNNDPNIYIESRATSYEEIGNDIYPPAKRCLKAHGIPFTLHSASHLEKSDCDAFDLLICMDSYNVTNTKRIAGDSNYHKIHKMLDYVNISRDVADPWYTGNFEDTYNDIYSSCIKLYELIK